MNFNKYLFLSLALLLPTFGSGQNWQACDSLTINCCDYISGGSNTVSLTVSNASSVLFDYPGFILFDSNMDTLAIETVNYFGISSNPQQHIMTIVAPFSLPLNGFLNLYSAFYDTLACSFPITLPDTISGIQEDALSNISVHLSPNPLSGDQLLTLTTHHLPPGLANITITDIQGRVVIDGDWKKDVSDATQLDTHELKPGLYLLNLVLNGSVYSVKFLKI